MTLSTWSLRLIRRRQFAAIIRSPEWMRCRFWIRSQNGCPGAGEQSPSATEGPVHPVDPHSLRRSHKSSLCHPQIQNKMYCPSPDSKNSSLFQTGLLFHQAVSRQGRKKKKNTSEGKQFTPQFASKVTPMQTSLYSTKLVSAVLSGGRLQRINGQVSLTWSRLFTDWPKLRTSLRLQVMVATHHSWFL